MDMSEDVVPTAQGVRDLEEAVGSAVSTDICPSGVRMKKNLAQTEMGKWLDEAHDGLVGEKVEQEAEDDRYLSAPAGGGVCPTIGF